LFTALTVIVVVLVVGVVGAVTGTLMVWLIEADAVAGTGFDGVTVPITQVPDGDPGATDAVTVKVEGYPTSLYVNRKVKVVCSPGVNWRALLVLVRVRLQLFHANTGATAPNPTRVDSNRRAGIAYFLLLIV